MNRQLLREPYRAVLHIVRMHMHVSFIKWCLYIGIVIFRLANLPIKKKKNSIVSLITASIL